MQPLSWRALVLAATSATASSKSNAAAQKVQFIYSIQGLAHPDVLLKKPVPAHSPEKTFGSRGGRTKMQAHTRRLRVIPSWHEGRRLDMNTPCDWPWPAEAFVALPCEPDGGPLPLGMCWLAPGASPWGPARATLGHVPRVQSCRLQWRSAMTYTMIVLQE